MDQILFLVVGLVVGAILVGAFVFMRNKALKKESQKEANKMLNKARAEAQKIEKQAKEKARNLEVRAKKNMETESRKQKDQLQAEQKKLASKSKDLDKNYRKKLESVEKTELSIKEREEKIKAAETRVDAMSKNYEQESLKLADELARISQLSAEDAKDKLLETVKKEAEAKAAKTVITIEEDAKSNAEKKANRIIGMAISRFAGEYSSSKTSNIIALPTPDMKGKIIGKEGRNIRAIETLCGVDLVLDEAPEAVVVSGFDPVRRVVAARSLTTLMEDGRIHPGRIEEVVQKTKKELFKSIKLDGEKACLELGLAGVHPEIQKLVGSLQYRTSYTQNNYSHSIEVGMLCGLMAAEMGEDVKAARRAGLFHDIGKAMDHSIEGSHAVIGADFAKRYGESEKVCHAIRSHHEDEKPRTVLAYLTQAADTLSGARPGARKSTAENYVQRLEDLESIANSFEGVERTFAIQAGREIRVVVDSSRVTDEQSLMLSKDIARKVEKEMKYPGQIRISVVRETRAVEHAR